MLKLEDLFSYGGENYVPEDYRHEEFDDLKIHGFADLHFKFQRFVFRFCQIFAFRSLFSDFSL